MSLSLPTPIANYFAADAAHRAEVAKCFAEDGVVVDEKRTFRGRAAIARWKTESSAKYDYVSEPFAVDDQDERIIVTAHLTGNFPRSPVNLRYAFTLAGNEIARLEITL